MSHPTNISSPSSYARDLSQTSPPTDFVVIDVSSQDQVFDPPLRALSWGVDGDIVMDTLQSNNKTLPSGSLAATLQHGMAIRKIYSSGTTAAGLVGWY